MIQLISLYLLQCLSANWQSESPLRSIPKALEAQSNQNNLRTFNDSADLSVPASQQLQICRTP